MGQFGKRFIALMLTVFMLTGILPFGIAADETTVNVIGQQLMLGDDFRMHFFVTVNGNADKTKAVITVGGAEAISYSIGNVTPLEDGSYDLCVDLAAAQMSDRISIDFQNESGSILRKEYAIRDYAHYLLENDYSDETQTLVKKMLNYGAKAQIYFNYNMSDLADSGYEIQTEAVIPPVTSEITVAENLPGVDYYGASMVFESKIAVRYYFYAPDGIEGCSFTVNDLSYTPERSGGYYFIEVADINPDQMDQKMSVSVKKDGGYITLEYSPLDYMIRMYNRESTSQTLKNMLAAAYDYFEAAKVFTGVSQKHTEAETDMLYNGTLVFNKSHWTEENGLSYGKDTTNVTGNGSTESWRFSATENAAIDGVAQILLDRSYDLTGYALVFDVKLESSNENASAYLLTRLHDHNWLDVTKNKSVSLSCGEWQTVTLDFADALTTDTTTGEPRNLSDVMLVTFILGFSQNPGSIRNVYIDNLHLKRVESATEDWTNMAIDAGMSKTATYSLSEEKKANSSGQSLKITTGDAAGKVTFNPEAAQISGQIPKCPDLTGGSVGAWFYFGNQTPSATLRLIEGLWKGTNTVPFTFTSGENGWYYGTVDCKEFTYSENDINAGASSSKIIRMEITIPAGYTVYVDCMTHTPGTPEWIIADFEDGNDLSNYFISSVSSALNYAVEKPDYADSTGLHITWIGTLNTDDRTGIRFTPEKFGTGFGFTVTAHNELTEGSTFAPMLVGFTTVVNGATKNFVYHGPIYPNDPNSLVQDYGAVYCDANTKASYEFDYSQFIYAQSGVGYGAKVDMPPTEEDLANITAIFINIYGLGANLSRDTVIDDVKIIGVQPPAVDTEATIDESALIVDFEKGSNNPKECYIATAEMDYTIEKTDYSNSTGLHLQWTEKIDTDAKKGIKFTPPIVGNGFGFTVTTNNNITEGSNFAAMLVGFSTKTAAGIKNFVYCGPVYPNDASSSQQDFGAVYCAANTSESYLFNFSDFCYATSGVGYGAAADIKPTAEELKNITTIFINVYGLSDTLCRDIVIDDVIFCGGKGTVTVPQTVGGTVTTDKIYAEQGETVTITAVPDAGFVLRPTQLQVVSRDNGEPVCALAENTDGTYSFVMPGEHILVRAEFLSEDALKLEDILLFQNVSANTSDQSISFRYSLLSTDNKIRLEGKEHPIVSYGVLISSAKELLGAELTLDKCQAVYNALTDSTVICSSENGKTVFGVTVSDINTDLEQAEEIVSRAYLQYQNGDTTETFYLTARGVSFNDFFAATDTHEISDLETGYLDGYYLEFGDEFNGDALNTSIWNPEYLAFATTEDERCAATYRFEDGKLVMYLTEETPEFREGQPAVASSIQTWDKTYLHPGATYKRDIDPFEGYASLYGYYEVRMKLPNCGGGGHVAWWMIGIQNDTEEFNPVTNKTLSKEVAEWDIVETLHSTPNLYQPKLHSWTAGSETFSITLPGGPSAYTEQYHVFAMNWTPERADFYVDGNYMCSTTSVDYPMATLLSIYTARGANWSGTDNGVYPKEWFIDYFRVYKPIGGYNTDYSIGVQATDLMTVSAEDSCNAAMNISNFMNRNTANADLTSILLDGVAIENFDPDVLHYTVTVDAAMTAVPRGSVTSHSPFTDITLTNATNFDCTTKIRVASEDGTVVKNYVISFVQEDSDEPTEPDTTEPEATEPEVTEDDSILIDFENSSELSENGISGISSILTYAIEQPDYAFGKGLHLSWPGQKIQSYGKVGVTFAPEKFGTKFGFQVTTYNTSTTGSTFAPLLVGFTTKVDGVTKDFVYYGKLYPNDPGSSNQNFGAVYCDANMTESYLFDLSEFAYASGGVGIGITEHTKPTVEELANITGVFIYVYGSGENLCRDILIDDVTFYNLKAD